MGHKPWNDRVVLPRAGRWYKTASRWGSAMTPTEKWMLGLVAVYSIPSFLFGVGITLLFVRWRGLFTFPARSNPLSPNERMAAGFVPANQDSALLGS